MPYSPVQVRFFGAPGLEVGAEFITLPPRQIAVLALVAIAAPKPIDRGTVAEMVWPRSGSATARHSLSQALYSIRRATQGVTLIRATNKALQWGEGPCDYHRFLAFVGNGEWGPAADLYRGDFLAGIDVPGATGLYEFLADRRIEFATRAERVLEELSLDGDVDRAGRLRQALTGWIDAENKLTSETPIKESASVFVGRSDEMSQLERLYNQAISGKFTIVITEGESGIGKSALGNRFARRRALRGSRVLQARGYPAEKNVPFGVTAQWIRDLRPSWIKDIEPEWLDIIRRAFPKTISEVTGSELSGEPGFGSIGEYLLLEALSSTFDAVAQDSGLVLVLDDLQYSDKATRSFLHYFQRRSSHSNIMVLATLRTPTYGDDPLYGWTDLVRLGLGPLSRDNLKTLALRTGGSDVLNRLGIESLIESTGGNPMLFLSLLGREGNDDTGALPESVMEYFRPRLAALSRDALLMLAATSVVTEALELDALAEIAGVVLSSSTASAALNELSQGDLVEFTANDTVRAKHGIIGEIALALLGIADQRLLHGRAARILTERALSPASVLAIHHDIAGDRTRAFEAAVTAADASRSLHAPREREFFLKLAMANAPDPEIRAGLRVELAEHLAQTARWTEADELLSSVLMSSASDSAKRRGLAARIMIRLKANAANATTETWNEINELCPDIDPLQSGELYYQFASAAHAIGSVAGTVEASQRALQISRKADSSPRAAIVGAKSAKALGLYSSLNDGLEAIEHVRTMAESDVESHLAYLSANGTLLVAAGNLVAGEDSYLMALSFAMRGGTYREVLELQNNLGVCYTEQGRYPEARVQLEAASKIGEEYGAIDHHAFAVDNMAILEWEHGRYAEALLIARPALKAQDGSSRRLFQRHAIVGLCSLEMGLLAQASESKREIDLLLLHHEYWSSDVSYVETFLARMLVLDGNVSAARERLTTAIDVYRERDMMCRSRLELELGRLELKTDPAAALERAGRMLELLKGSGARPLIERFEELADRARIRSA